MTIRRTVILNAAVLLSLAASVVSASAATPPDFSGVYYPINPFGPPRPAGKAGGPPGAGKQKGPPPRPARSAPLSDGSRGRAPDAPSLTPEYMAKWQMISKTRIAGSSEYD